VLSAVVNLHVKRQIFPSQLKMGPIQEFRWCLSIVRKLLKLASQDIFQANHRNGIGYYVTFLLWLFVIWCYAATVIDEQFDISIRFNCAGALIGVFQVHSAFLNHLKQQISLSFLFYRLSSNTIFCETFSICYQQLNSLPIFMRKIPNQAANTMIFVKDLRESRDWLLNWDSLCT
jgi:hypothetical protein